MVTLEYEQISFWKTVKTQNLTKLCPHINLILEICKSQKQGKKRKTKQCEQVLPWKKWNQISTKLTLLLRFLSFVLLSLKVSMLCFLYCLLSFSHFSFLPQHYQFSRVWIFLWYPLLLFSVYGKPTLTLFLLLIKHFVKLVLSLLDYVQPTFEPQLESVGLLPVLQELLFLPLITFVSD